MAQQVATVNHLGSDVSSSALTNITMIMNNSTTANNQSGIASVVEFLFYTLYDYCFNSIFGIIFNIVLILLIQTKTSGYLTVENHLLYRLRMILPEMGQQTSKVIKISTMNEAVIKTLYFYNDLDYLFFTFMIMIFSLKNVYNYLVVIIFLILLFRIYTNMYQKRRNILYYLTFVVSFLLSFICMDYFNASCGNEIEHRAIYYIKNHIKHYFFVYDDHSTRGMANGWLLNVWNFLFENSTNFSLFLFLFINLIVSYFLNLVVEFDYISKCHIYFTSFKEYHHFVIGGKSFKDKKIFNLYSLASRYLSHFQLLVLPLLVFFLDHTEHIKVSLFCALNILMHFIYFRIYLKSYFIYRALHYNKYKQPQKMINLVKFTILYSLKNLIVPFISTVLLALYVITDYSCVVFYTIYIYYATSGTIGLLTYFFVKAFSHNLL